jgi:hypothetical protein
MRFGERKSRFGFKTSHFKGQGRNDYIQTKLVYKTGYPPFFDCTFEAPT